jgi:hypothetical protein
MSSNKQYMVFYTWYMVWIHAAAFSAVHTLWILSNFCKAVGFWKADTLLIMNVEQVSSADMFEAKFKGNVLSKSAGREYREKVKCVFLKKNDVCINIGF